MDFLQGLKTNTGLVVFVLSLIIGAHATNAEITEAVAGIGQLVGGVLATYGLIMKIVRRIKTNEVVKE